MSNKAKSKPELVFSKYVHTIQTGKKEYALYSGLSSALIKTDKTVQQLQKQLCESRSGINKDLKIQLQEGLFLIPATMNELEYLNQRYQFMKYRNRGLYVTIIPTFRCNLRCGYCFQDRNNNDTMSEKTKKLLIRSLKQNINASSHYKILSTIWYGGEPLLMVDDILGIGLKLKRYCETKKLKYESNIITNATLLNEKTADILVEAGVTGCQITLDGPKHIHDKRRPFPKPNNSSFVKTVDGIIAAMEKMKVRIRINLEPANIAYVEELLDELETYNLSEYLQSGKIEVYLGRVFDCSKGGSCRYGSELYSVEQFATVEMDILNKFFERGINSINFPIAKLFFCSAIDVDSFVVDPIGNMYKCYANAWDKKQSFGKLGKPVKFTSEQLQCWMTYDPFKAKECRDCKYLPLCGGGCPLLSIKEKNRKVEICERWRFVLDKYLEHFVTKATTRS